MLRIFVASKAGRRSLEHHRGPLELGRGPRREVLRLSIDDPAVSNHHLAVEEADGGKVRLEALSIRIDSRLADGKTLAPGAVRVYDLPMRISVGSTLIQIEAVGDVAEADPAHFRTIGRCRVGTNSGAKGPASMPYRTWPAAPDMGPMRPQSQRRGEARVFLGLLGPTSPSESGLPRSRGAIPAGHPHRVDEQRALGHRYLIRRLPCRAAVGATLEGHTEGEAFGCVNESMGKPLPWAEECWVVLGLYVHPGQGRTDGGVVGLVESIRPLRLRVIPDRGNSILHFFAIRHSSWPHLDACSLCT